MAGGGNYVKPRATIKETLDKYYEEHKYLLEITTVLFVIAGLFLSVKAEQNLKGEIIRLLQFSLLLASVIPLVYLLGDFLLTFLRRFGEKINDIEEFPVVLSFTAAIFGAFSAFIFSITLALYIFLSFPAEAKFSLLTALSFSLFVPLVLITRGMQPYGKTQRIVLPLIIFLWVLIWLLIPLSLYIELLNPGVFISLKDKLIGIYSALGM